MWNRGGRSWLALECDCRFHQPFSASVQPAHSMTHSHLLFPTSYPEAQQMSIWNVIINYYYKCKVNVCFDVREFPFGMFFFKWQPSLEMFHFKPLIHVEKHVILLVLCYSTSETEFSITLLCQEH